MAALFKAKGTFVSGTGNVTPTLPGGMAAGDFMLLFVHSANQAASAPSGWTAIPTVSGDPFRGTAGAAGGVRLDIFYRWWQSGDGNPTVTDTGDITCAIICAYSGVDPTTPFDGVTPVAANQAASTTLTFPGITTATDLALVVFAAARDNDTASTDGAGGLTNSNLTQLNERHDQTVTTNTGGGLYIGDAVDIAAGATGDITATQASSAAGVITLALRSADDWRRDIGVWGQNGQTVASRSTTTMVTTDFTPRDNSLLVVIATWSYNVTLASFSVSGGGLTWNPIIDILQSGVNGGYNTGIRGWYAEVTTGASMAITLTSTATTGTESQDSRAIAVIDFIDYDTTDPIGEIITNAAAGDGSLTLTLPGAPASTSDVIGAVSNSPDGGDLLTSTPGSGWTEIFDNGVAGWGHLQVQYRRGSTSTSVEWSDAASALIYLDHSVAFAFEVKQAAAGGGIEGTASPTLDGITSAATGLVKIAGAASPNLAAITSDAAAKLLNQGAASLSLGAITASGAAALLNTGAVAASLGDVTVTANGAFVINGAASPTLDAITVAATGQLPIKGVVSPNLAAITTTATGLLPNRGAASPTLAAVTAAGAAALEVNGAVNATLDAITATATGVLRIQGAVVGAVIESVMTTAPAALRILGSASPTLDAITVAASGQSIVGGYGEVDATLDAITVAASGELDNRGAANLTFAISSSGAAGLLIEGDVAVTLDGITTTSAAQLGLKGELQLQFISLSIVATATLPVRATLTATLDDITTTAYGIEGQEGQLDAVALFAGSRVAEAAFTASRVALAEMTGSRIATATLTGKVD